MRARPRLARAMYCWEETRFAALSTGCRRRRRVVACCGCWRDARERSGLDVSEYLAVTSQGTAAGLGVPVNVAASHRGQFGVTRPTIYRHLQRPSAWPTAVSGGENVLAAVLAHALCRPNARVHVAGPKVAVSEVPTGGGDGT